MPESTTAASGQASQSGETAGQAPQASTKNGNGSPTAAPEGQAPDGNTTASSGQQMSTGDYERIIADLRKENASHRTKLKQIEDASLTAEQKRERDVTDMQTRLFELEARAQTQSLQLAGYRLGAQLGIGDISAALALVQAEHGTEIKYSPTGEPENIQDLLKAVLKEHPVLAGGGQAPVRPGASSGGATNPGAIARPGGTFTREQIRSMSPREYEQNRQAIMDQLKSGTLRP